jgi:ribosome-associated heat shock protein Hsp15
VPESRDLTSVRVDVWAWGVRLYATRSAATDACRAGHVRVNGTRIKPAHQVRPGDTVRALTPRGERIVVVVGLTTKRTSATIAVQNYEDHSPPPEPKDTLAASVLRERGSGRPTKRDRRRVERLRGRG